MHFKMTREKLIILISAVQSVVDRKNILNILSNLKINLSPEEISITGTDLEVELIARANVSKNECIEPGSVTLPARKLFEICKAVQPNATLDLKITDDGRCIVKSNQSKFALGTLPASDYPILSGSVHKTENLNRTIVNIGVAEFKKLFEKTAFSMAVQDVRFYLTGTLLEFDKNIVRAVTTDGHRMSICETAASTNNIEPIQSILPKKAVSELQRLLQIGNDRIELKIGRELITASIFIETKENINYSVQFTTKMIDGKYPDYRRVIPKNNSKTAVVDIEDFKQAIHRVSILSNERNGCVIITFTKNEIKLIASNNDQDEANEYLATEYDGDEMEVAFSGQYLTDILNCLDSTTAIINLNQQNDSVLISSPDDIVKKYVVMPRRV